jgi:chromosome partitioning protein
MAIRVVSFVSQKGGTGKSVLAIGIAVAAESAGEKVVLFDLDPQGTVAHWHDVRTAETPAVIAHNEIGTLDNLPAAIAALAAKGYTLAIVDTVGANTPATRRAMQCADLCLVPIRPHAPDLHAATATIDALQGMGRTFAIVLNQAAARKFKITDIIMAALAQRGDVVPFPIATRIDHPQAYALGLAATEYEPAGKAAAEITELWAWCRKRLGKERNVWPIEEARRTRP